MKSKSLATIILSSLAALAVAPAASAAPSSVNLQAGSGHAKTGHHSKFALYDSRAAQLSINHTSYTSKTYNGTWVVPLPLDATGKNWYSRVRGNQLTSRICSYDQHGNFSGCGNVVSSGSTSIVYVPPSGNAFVPGYLTATCSSPSQTCGTVAKFYSVNAWSY